MSTTSCNHLSVAMTTHNFRIMISFLAALRTFLPSFLRNFLQTNTLSVCLSFARHSSQNSFLRKEKRKGKTNSKKVNLKDKHGINGTRVVLGTNKWINLIWLDLLTGKSLNLKRLFTVRRTVSSENTITVIHIGLTLNIENVKCSFTSRALTNVCVGIKRSQMQMLPYGLSHGFACV